MDGLVNSLRKIKGGANLGRYAGGFRCVQGNMQRKPQAACGKKTPSRVLYAEEQLKAHGIKYEIKNPAIGHFHCWRRSDGKLIQFWAGTGKIMGYANLRGIHNLIKLCEKTTD